MFKLTKRASHYGQTDRSTLIIKSFAFKNVLLKPVTSLQIIPCIAKTKFRCREKNARLLDQKGALRFFSPTHTHTHIQIWLSLYLALLRLAIGSNGPPKKHHTHTHTRTQTHPRTYSFLYKYTCWFSHFLAYRRSGKIVKSGPLCWLCRVGGYRPGFWSTSAGLKPPYSLTGVSSFLHNFIFNRKVLKNLTE